MLEQKRHFTINKGKAESNLRRLLRVDFGSVRFVSTASKMADSISVDPERISKVESFFNACSYKEYLESATAFNRKLNEERRMRLPYIDGQTGVAQRHYNTLRASKERMPGAKVGQIYSYPQRQWRKKKYQYLKFFLMPKRTAVFDPEAEMHTISQIENPSINEDSSQSGSKDDTKTAVSDWGYYEEDIFPDEGDNDFNSDSDDDVEYSSKKKKGKAKGGKSKGSSKSSSTSTPSKRRTHADSIPDSEKPYSCELCGARYKTRPGLAYHYKNTHKDRDGSLPLGGGAGPHSAGQHASGQSQQQQQPYHHYLDENAVLMMEDGVQMSTLDGVPGNSRGGPSRRSAMGVSYREADLFAVGAAFEAEAQPAKAGGSKTISGKDRAAPLGYCDFCLGDKAENKKTGSAEELVSCAECGRSGHPSCLQFTDNMKVSVRQYPWQCIECKCCTLCGTSENDDQLLFCDDCDRGYHMYCLVPPIKEPPEGTWSCKLCIERFHKKH